MPDYLITATIPGDGLHGPDRDIPRKRERLVRARNRAAAVAHVVADTLEVRVADTDDVMRVAQAGGKVEHAAETPE